MLAVLAKVTVKPNLVARFLKHLDVDVTGSRAEPGCVRFDVWRDADAANVFYLYEVYRDRAAYAEHQASPHFKAFFAEAGDTLSEPPEIRFGESVL